MKVNVCKGPTWAYKQALSNKTDHDRKLDLEKPSCLPRAVQNRPACILIHKSRCIRGVQIRDEGLNEGFLCKESDFGVLKQGHTVCRLFYVCLNCELI
jgi:hypothetical protein